MWDLNPSMLKILFPLPYSMWDIDLSMRKESQSKNQIQEFKEIQLKKQPTTLSKMKNYKN